MADITAIDIVPNASGCGHAELRATVNGVLHRVSIRRSDFALETPEDVLTAVLNRIRSHIKESGLTNPTLIRQDLQTRSFKI